MIVNLSEFAKLAILDEKNREVGIVKCAQKKGFWTIQCVGGSASTQLLGGVVWTQPQGGWSLHRTSRWVGS